MRPSCIHIVDDEPVILASVAMMLGVLGYECQLWNSPITFLAEAEIGSDHAILTDLRMPGADGFELLRRVRSKGLTTPAILMTGHGTHKTIADALEAGFCAAMLKPFSMAELHESVGSASNVSAGQEAGEPSWFE